MAKLLATYVDGTGKCPDGGENERQSAMRFGIIVGSAKDLTPMDFMSIKMLMELVYEDVTPSFNKGLILAKELMRGEEGATIRAPSAATSRPRPRPCRLGSRKVCHGMK